MNLFGKCFSHLSGLSCQPLTYLLSCPQKEKQKIPHPSVSLTDILLVGRGQI